MRVYLAGPMTGLPDFNYPAFHAAAAHWREHGHHIKNPAENFGGDQAKEYREYIREDLRMLLECEAIALLPGWERSNGACFELNVAEMLGFTVFDAMTMEVIPGLEPEVRASSLRFDQP